MSQEKILPRAVIESGFGNQGSESDNILIETPIVANNLTEQTKQKLIETGSSKPGEILEPIEAIAVAGDNSNPLVKAVSQAFKLTFSQLLNTDDSGLPIMVQTIKKANGTSITVKQSAASVNTREGYFLVQKNGGDTGFYKLPQMIFVFGQAEGATVEQYLTARDLIVKEVNKTLKAFGINDPKDQLPDLGDSALCRDSI